MYERDHFIIVMPRQANHVIMAYNREKDLSMTKKHCFLLLAVFFVLPATGFACSCGTGDPPFEYNRAKAIFIGKMLGGTEILTRKNQNGKPVSIEAGKVRFRVDENFKGSLVGEVVIQVASMKGTSCGDYGLMRGAQYIVYAYGDDEQSLSTGVCTRTVEVESKYAKEDLEFLRHLPAPGTGGNLRGRIWADLRAGGATPLPDVKVHVRSAEGQDQLVTTDKDGAFELKKLKPGKYQVKPDWPEYYTTDRPVADVIVEDRGTAGVGFEAYRNGSIIGKMQDVDGRTYNGSFLHLVEKGVAKGRSTYGHSIGEEGLFSFFGVPPGEYVMYLELEGTDYKKNKNYYYPGTFVQAAATPIKVGLGSKVEDLLFTLPKEYKVRSLAGQVVWADGKPAAEVEVMLLCPQSVNPNGHAIEFTPPSVKTDEQGRFQLEGFTSEVYWLEARATRKQEGKAWEVHSPPMKIAPTVNMENLKVILSEQGFSKGCGSK